MNASRTFKPALSVDFSKATGITKLAGGVAMSENMKDVVSSAMQLRNARLNKAASEVIGKIQHTQSAYIIRCSFLLPSSLHLSQP